jgi:hypothetical protein
VRDETGSNEPSGRGANPARGNAEADTRQGKDNPPVASEEW